MVYAHRLIGVAVCGLLTLAACSREQRTETESRGEAVENTVRAALSVIDVDLGKTISVDNRIMDKTDEFMPRDTIYASVHTSGTQASGTVIGRWTMRDGTVVDEQTRMVTTDGDGYTTFSLSKAGGLARGDYTLHVIVDGREVRSKDFTVK
jgi:hypothetical protein